MTNQEHSWVVLKFGGSSVSSQTDWDNIASIVKSNIESGKKVAVIHSAFKNVTNELEAIAQLAVADESDEALNQLLNKHKAMAHELEVDATLLDPWFDSLQIAIADIRHKEQLTAMDRAQVVSHGELLSSVLGAEFLRKILGEEHRVQWLDARQILTSESSQHQNVNDRFLNAVCHPRPSQELANQWASDADVVLSQGFIAGNEDGQTVLLGREGSDTSAAYFAALLQADKLEIWTDVAGMFSTDPNKISNAKKLENISYNEAFDMAEAGAKVLHPRCLSAVMAYNIPIEIRNTHKPDESGTLITSDYEPSKWVKAIALKQQIPIITLLLGRRGQQPDTLQKVFTIINEFGLSSELMASTKNSLVMAIETNNSIYSDSILQKLSEKLAEVCRSVFTSHSAMLTLIGCDASQALWHLLQIDADLPEQWLLLSHATGDHHLSFLVNDDDALKILQLLHDNLIK